MTNGRNALSGAHPHRQPGDLSRRAAETLAAADFLAVEDTRVTVKLLNHLELRKPMVIYHRHNCAQAGPAIVERLLAGESCALVTDAGMPAISDPGEDLVRLCAQHGIGVVPVPGACALVSAIAVSGLPTQRFCFEGFLSTANRSRAQHLAELKTEKRTIILYEAPHKLLNTLEDLLNTLGDRDISLCRELTKLHEQVLRTTVSGAIAHFRETPPKGEFVLVIAGASEEVPQRATPEQALAALLRYREAGNSLRAAAGLAAQETGWTKNELYALGTQP